MERPDWPSTSSGEDDERSMAYSQAQHVSMAEKHCFSGGNLIFRDQCNYPSFSGVKEMGAIAIPCLKKVLIFATDRFPGKDLMLKSVIPFT